MDESNYTKQFKISNFTCKTQIPKQEKCTLSHCYTMFIHNYKLNALDTVL